jgi:hypothetical protein
MAEDTVRVLRMVEYIGKRSWVEATISRSIHGVKEVPGKGTIQAVTLGEFPEIWGQVVPAVKESAP